MLKLTVLVLVLASLFSGLHSQLTCQCSGVTCSGNVTVCADASYVCSAAEIRQADSSIKVEKGCKKKTECNHIDYCPTRAPTDVCAKYGCCDYNGCVVTNWTVGVDLNPPTPTPSPSPSPSTTQKPPMASSPPLVLAATSSPVPMTTKPPVTMTTKPPVAMTTKPPVAMTTKPPVAMTTKPPVAMTTKPQVAMTTKPQVAMTTRQPMAKITTEPVVTTIKMSADMPMMSAFKSMTSAKPEVKPTGSKEMMMSSTVKMKPSIKGSASPTGRVYTSEALFTGKKITVDDRPTCDNNAPGLRFSLSAFVVIAVALLCSMF